jgi:hypothetical protein
MSIQLPVKPEHPRAPVRVLLVLQLLPARSPLRRDLVRCGRKRSWLRRTRDVAACQRFRAGGSAVASALPCPLDAATAPLSACSAAAASENRPLRSSRTSTCRGLGLGLERSGHVAYSGAGGSPTHSFVPSGSKISSLVVVIVQGRSAHSGGLSRSCRRSTSPPSHAFSIHPPFQPADLLCQSLSRAGSAALDRGYAESCVRTSENTPSRRLGE